MTVIEGTSIRRNHVRRDRDSITPETLVRDAHRLLDACGVQRGANWVARIVRDFMAESISRMPFGLFLIARVQLNAAQRRMLAERADLRYLLDYADPTGETAIRNVMREEH